MMESKDHIILAIESSCDETGASVYKPGLGVCSNALFSQVALHKSFGGVVPEIASRSHLEKMNEMVQAALDQAQCTLADIDAIAVTNKPGLPGSLLVGVCFAKALAATTNKKLIGIDHLQAHVFSVCIEHAVPFPHVCLLASGGNTALYLVRAMGECTLVASTLDDAIGEAFDKVAKLIGLPYPGGPVMEQYAARNNFEDSFHYPRARHKTLEFSFSGLKTAVLYDLVKRGAYDLANKTFLKPDDEVLKQQVASSLSVCIGDIIAEKLALVLEQYPEIKAITFVGGVACNRYLRSHINDFCTTNKVQFFVPSAQYCGDNAGMVAFLAAWYAKQGLFADLTLDILD